MSVSLWASQAQWYRIRLPLKEMQVQSLGWEDPLEEEITAHSSIIPQIEEPGGLWSMGSQRVRRDCVTEYTHCFSMVSASRRGAGLLNQYRLSGS